MKRCQGAAAMLQPFGDDPNEEQKRDLANVIAEIRAAATWLGAV